MQSAVFVGVLVVQSGLRGVRSVPCRNPRACWVDLSKSQYVDKILDPQSIDSEADSDAPRPACQTSKTGLDALPRTYATATRVPG